MIKTIKEIFAYRELLKNSIKKEIRGKYKGAWLGIIWSFLNPLLMLAVYSFIFPLILKVNETNYTMFLFTALIPWTFFTTTVSLGTYSVITGGALLKKVYFPREVLPISVVTSGVVNFLISCVIMFIFLIFSGIGFSWYILLFPALTLIEYILLLGLTFILSACTVYIRDIEHFVSLALLVLFYATPIAYNMNTLPSDVAKILMLNPMTYIINGFRDILYYQQMPNMWHLLGIFVFSIVLLYIGLMIFKKLSKGFAEEL